MRRRNFLKSTSGALIGSASLRNVTAKSNISANDKVSIAMMGVRGRGTWLTRYFSALPEVDIPYICDVDPSVVGPATEVIETKKGKTPKLVDDIRYVLDDQSIDAVIIATPIVWHSAATILACEAGKDVYVEKPVSHNIREGRLAVEAARRNDRIVQVGTQRRSSNGTNRFIDYVQSGKIGRLLMAKIWNVQMRSNIGHKSDEPVPADINYDNWTGPVTMLPFNRNRFHHKYNWNWHYGAGDIANDGSHWLDLGLWALDLGHPSEVSGMGRKLFFDDDQETPDTQNATYKYKDKVLMYEQRLWNPYMMDNSQCGIAVYGTEGYATFSEDNGESFKVFDQKGKLAHLEFEASESKWTPWELNGESHYQNFINCIRSRQKPNADIEVGHMAASLCHLGNIVARTGRTIHFDSTTETITGDADANRLVSGNYRKHWSSELLIS